MKIWTDKNYPIIISCAKQLSRWTEVEVRDMGYEPIEVTENTVVVRGDMHDVMKLNLNLRTAHRVLVPLLRTYCNNIRDLYKAAYSIDWENLLDADGYFSVFSIVHNYSIRDTRLPSLYTKDAIADRMRDKCQRRPNSGGENIGAAVFVYWERDEVIIYLDTSGEPLSKRGYRKIPGSAPMQETLAAACIMALRWDKKSPFISPMCGSGTPAIEAAMMAMNKAPGSLKDHFAFQSIKGYTRIIPGLKAPNVAPRQYAGASPEQIWKEIVLESKANEKKENIPAIVATDISPEAVENAHTNAIAAGVAPYIRFKACDFGETEIPEGDEKGVVFFNPEYGIRLGTYEELAPVYQRIGTFMHEKCSGYTGGLITGNPDLARMVDLYYQARVPFFNGPIDCRLFIYGGCELKGHNQQ
ncbi:MAG: class I SAM-dependent RNA methyltransferase [Kiritimatiellae bacterium]|jgi:putative N6-adenine-specific DNA methylase|nr:class I SAM-dependent RNA methyltransferase [Kiritimatiellia bacterium]